MNCTICWQRKAKIVVLPFLVFVPLPYGPSLKIIPSDLTWVPWVSWVYRCWDRTNLSSVLNMVEVNWFLMKTMICTFVGWCLHILRQNWTFAHLKAWCLHICGWCIFFFYRFAHLREKCLHKCGCLHIWGRNVCTNVGCLHINFVGEMFAQMWLFAHLWAKCLHKCGCLHIVGFCTFHGSTRPKNYTFKTNYRSSNIWKQSSIEIIHLISQNDLTIYSNLFTSSFNLASYILS